MFNIQGKREEDVKSEKLKVKSYGVATVFDRDGWRPGIGVPTLSGGLAPAGECGGEMGSGVRLTQGATRCARSALGYDMLALWAVFRVSLRVGVFIDKLEACPTMGGWFRRA